MAQGEEHIENGSEGRVSPHHRPPRHRRIYKDTWIIEHIFDGEYGCEAEAEDDEQLLVVTLGNALGEHCETRVTDAYLKENNLDVGSPWPRGAEV